MGHADEVVGSEGFHEWEGESVRTHAGAFDEVRVRVCLVL
jgi:hypothetical protein